MSTNPISRGKFSIQQFLRLKELATNTVGVNNSIFDIELISLLTLYKSPAKEIDTLEAEINKQIEEVHLSVPSEIRYIDGLLELPFLI